VKHIRLAGALRPDIPFSSEDSTHYLPWVVAVIVALFGLMLCAAISLYQTSQSATRLNIRSFQVYVPYGDDQQAMQQRVSAAIAQVDGIASHAPVTDTTLQNLIRPWAGDSLPLSELPMPSVIEVQLRADAPRENVIAQVTKAVKAISPKVDVESYQSWVDQLLTFNRYLQMAIALMLSMLLAALITLIVIVVRTSLRLHRSTILLLHHIGATDEYISRQFLINGGILIAKGSLMGMGMAMMIAVMLSTLSLELSSPLLPAIELTTAHFIMLMSLPLIVPAMAWGIVHLTVRRLLESMH
jgi:cell division transport system permease protein